MSVNSCNINNDWQIILVIGAVNGAFWIMYCNSRSILECVASISFQQEKNTTQQDTCQKFNPPLSKSLRFCPNLPRTKLTCTWEDDNTESFWLGRGGPKTLHSAIERVVECWLKSHLDASSIFQKPNFVCLGQRRLVAAAKDAPATQPTCVTHVAAERLSVEQQPASR